MSRAAAGGMFDFSQIQIPANLLAGLFTPAPHDWSTPLTVKWTNCACQSGGSGSAPSSSAAPARARVGEEDPAAIRLTLKIYKCGVNHGWDISSILYTSYLQGNAEGKPRPDGNAKAKQSKTLRSPWKWWPGSLCQGFNQFTIIWNSYHFEPVWRNSSCAGVERTTRCQEGEGTNENQVSIQALNFLL